MKIAVTHLTRMERGYFCVAGVNIDTGTHVRPVQPMGRLRDNLCAQRGGPFDMATVVDLGLTRPIPSPPEVEDYEFTPSHARATKLIEPALFWGMLTHLSRPSLRTIFGPNLRCVGAGSAIVDQGAGMASLGCLRPLRQPSMYLRSRADKPPQPRLRFSDGTFELDLSITDLRLVERDHQTVRGDVFDAAARRLDNGVPVLLSIGLTRPYSGDEDRAPVHWLQVNNLHFEDLPCWRLAEASPAATESAWRAEDSLEDLPF
jgi:Dual OB-containing domain